MPPARMLAITQGPKVLPARAFKPAIDLGVLRLLGVPALQRPGRNRQVVSDRPVMQMSMLSAGAK